MSKEIKQILDDYNLHHLNYIVNCIEEENKAQLKKWGVQKKHIFEWAMWTTEEFGEFIQSINEWNYERINTIDNIIKEGIQTITLIMKILDALLVQEK